MVEDGGPGLVEGLVLTSHKTTPTLFSPPCVERHELGACLMYAATFQVETDLHAVFFSF